MAVKFYVNAKGEFLYTLDAEAQPEEGAIEVESSPSAASDIWDGSGWIAGDVETAEAPTHPYAGARHYVNAEGEFLGTMVDGPAPWLDAIEVEAAPAHGRDLYINGKWVRNLATLRANSARLVSEAAEAIRLNYISPGSGKALAYQEKALEASDFVADPSPSAAKYPLIYAEVGITAEKATDVAAIILQRRNSFKAIEAAIAKVEAGAKKAINDATSAEEIEHVVADLTWPQP